MTSRELVGVYDSLDDALVDLTALEILHEDRLIENFDAAVIDQETGRPHIVKRVDRPRIRVIGEEFVSGALPRRELEVAARQLSRGQASLIVVGDSSLGKAARSSRGRPSSSTAPWTPALARSPAVCTRRSRAELPSCGWRASRPATR